MAKGSVFKRGKKWYYMFDIDDDSGRRKQIKRAGTESKSETEQLMRTAMKQYENEGMVFEPSNMKISELMDLWFKECCLNEIRHGTRQDYRYAIKHIKDHKLGNTKLKKLTPDILQQYIDDMTADRTLKNGTVRHGLSESTMKSHYAVLNGAFKYAVYPKRLLRENPMQYIKRRKNKRDLDVFLTEENQVQIVTIDEYKQILNYFEDTFYKLPIEIAFHTGLRAGEVCGLTWDDVDIRNQTLRVNKSMFYNFETKAWELGKTKTGKPRQIEIGNTLIQILKKARKQQLEKNMEYGEHYKTIYMERININGKDHLQLKAEPGGDTTIESSKKTKVNFICSKFDGDLFTPQTIKFSNKKVQKYLHLSHYHFHTLRHTHATMLIENKANMKDVQARLGHATLAITMDTYSHVTPKMKKETVNIFENAIGDL